MSEVILDDLHKLVLTEYQQLVIILYDFVIPVHNEIILNYLNIPNAPIRKSLKNLPCHRNNIDHKHPYDILLIMNVLNYLIAIGKIIEPQNLELAATGIFDYMHRNMDLKPKFYHENRSEIFSSVANYLNISLVVCWGTSFSIYTPRDFVKGYIYCYLFIDNEIKFIVDHNFRNLDAVHALLNVEIMDYHLKYTNLVNLIEPNPRYPIIRQHDHCNCYTHNYTCKKCKKTNTPDIKCDCVKDNCPFCKEYKSKYIELPYLSAPLYPNWRSNKYAIKQMEKYIKNKLNFINEMKSEARTTFNKVFDKDIVDSILKDTENFSIDMIINN